MLAARALRALPPRLTRPLATHVKKPHLEPITLKEYRIASKLKRRFQPPAHREFMDLMNVMQLHDFDTAHPKVIQAREAVEEAKREAAASKSGQRASTNYHLSRHLKRRR